MRYALQRPGAWTALVAILAAGCWSSAKPGHDAEPDADGWHSLFDGKTLAGWRPADFFGAGDPYVSEGSIILPTGAGLTGVRREDVPVLGYGVPGLEYEVEADAMRVEGSDIFCGLTFPVKEAHASLIIGGWGGMVCGISSIDGMSAVENETTTSRSFEDGKWYHVRLRVTDGLIEAWLDDEQIVDLETAGRKLSTRSDINAARPFGLASWRTRAAIRNVRWRKV